MTAVEAPKTSVPRVAAAAAEPDAGLAAAATDAGRALKIVVPVGMLILLIAIWQLYVTLANVPHYILPSPWRIAQAMATDWPILFRALLVTLRITFAALALALVGGVLLAIVLVQSKWAELAFYPYAVIM